ncbi:MAG: CHAP domain-containing protein [Candidatus Moranbacteria bacterium]|nr:CHAP domain-containing protein [Candidatus Moranbacteria bacterium]
MLRLICALLLCFVSVAYAAEDPNDTYLHRLDCPAVGGSFPVDTSSNFYKCQCTSYVAHKLNERWGNSSPRFTNQYYGFGAWSDAWKWLGRARDAEIGVTGGRDNFTWDVPSYNAIFPGDVALWEKGSGGYSVGHVAYVEAAGADASGKGVAWVTISEYNITSFEFSRRTLYKSNHPSPRFPDYFLHIDKDRIYCLANPTVGSCPSLIAGQQVANGPGNKVGGIGGGSDSFNLKINDFWVKDLAVGYTLVSEGHTVMTGQALEVRTQLKAWDGDTVSHMRSGKDSIEIDVYVREDVGDWRFLQREYTQAVNLPNGATHTEHVAYTVPAGVSEVSFKVKIDAEDEAYEANEGDNWSSIQTFVVNNTPTYDFMVTAIQVSTAQPVMAGSAMGAKMAIRNVGNSAPPVGIRSNYAIRGPGTNNLWMQIADDGSEPGDFIPGQDHWEEILSLVTAPTVPGTYDLRGCADYQNGVAEANEDNNCLAGNFTVIPRPAPNLTITRFQDQVGCCTTNTGSRIKPNIWVQNVGSVAPASNVTVIYHIASPVATGGAYIHIGYGVITPGELPPGGTDEDYMDGSGWQIPQNSAWKKQWHTVRGCIKPDGSVPVGGGPGEVCSYYTRYSKK